MSQSPLPTGMVFGVFDGFHPGHQFFLSQARARCERLVVVVALSEVVERMKKRPPLYSYEERVARIKEFDSSLTVVPSDPGLGDWQVLKNHQPDIVFLGYDQVALGQALADIAMPHAFIDSHYPEKYKSGLLRSAQETKEGN